METPNVTVHNILSGYKFSYFVLAGEIPAEKNNQEKNEENINSDTISIVDNFHKKIKDIKDVFSVENLKKEKLKINSDGPENIENKKSFEKISRIPINLIILEVN